MYSQGFREAAVKLYDLYHSMKRVSQALKTSLSTIWSWIRNGTQVKKRACTPVASEIVTFIKTILKQKPALTQKELTCSVLDRFNIKVSTRCVSSVLKDLRFSRKRLRFRGHANKQKLQEKIVDFKKRYNSALTDNIFAVDESGFDFRCLPVYGYSRRGEKAVVSTRGSNRTRTSLVMAINRKGQLYYDLIEGTTNAETFKTFLNTLPQNATVLMDNCSIHKTNAVRNALVSNRQSAFYIPPYTPECNPIENVFSVIKNLFRKRLNSADIEYKTFKGLLHSVIHDLDRRIFDKCFQHMEKWLESYETLL
jgi:transposase